MAKYQFYVAYELEPYHSSHGNGRRMPPVTEERTLHANTNEDAERAIHFIMAAHFGSWGKKRLRYEIKETKKTSCACKYCLEQALEVA